MHALNRNRPLRRVVLATAATVSSVVLLLSLKPHSTPAVALPSNSGASTTGSSGSSVTGTTTGTLTGTTVQTRYGPVQVRVTLKSGKITDVTAVSYPQDNPRDQQINSYAIPQLKREAITAQSANIDTVSGATYTSDGYRQSLQSALDSATG
ncbi:FMN-binding protein [Streptomyces sp. NPDC087263]|uniref:FMN-binding protein n=1 Tax=Streptomyces sp. NPDC087263 TaxID=3365773 RepID=UPI00381CA29A